MGNLDLYNSVRAVPQDAKKTIVGGRLSGYTDINPMWRIKTLTEQFGIVGVGWYYEIKNKWLETSMASDEITANVEIALYIKQDDEWSKPIPGVGGSMFVASEKKGLYTNDECYKMATTDAISVACKLLGIAADVYWENDATKYDGIDNRQAVDPHQKDAQKTITEEQETILVQWLDTKHKDVKDFCQYCGVEKLSDLTQYELTQQIYRNDFEGVRKGRVKETEPKNEESKQQKS